MILLPDYMVVLEECINKTFYHRLILEIKVEIYIGPKIGPIYLEFGADYMINEYDIAGVYTGSFSSLATPFVQKLDVGLAHAEVAAGPIFFMNSLSGEERQSIKTPFGFGDEFFVMAAASIDVKPLISLASVGAVLLDGLLPMVMIQFLPQS